MIYIYISSLSICFGEKAITQSAPEKSKAVAKHQQHLARYPILTSSSPSPPPHTPSSPHLPFPGLLPQETAAPSQNVTPLPPRSSVKTLVWLD